MGKYTWKSWRDNVNIREDGNLRDLVSYAIQSQYSASAKILALAAQYQNQLDPHEDIDLFYDKIVNIYTAEGVGLDTWGLILGINRAIPTWDNTSFITLEDEDYRALLLYKAMANISASTADAQNTLLAALMATGVGGFNGPAYVLEVDVMVIRFVFEFFLTDVQKAIFRVAGTLARGAGVGWELYALNPRETFGFDPGWQPFNQAPFAADDALISNRG